MSPGPLTTRRTALAAAVGMSGLAATGCTSDPADPAEGPAQSASTSAPPVDGDQVLVEAVVERLHTVLGVIVAAGDASRSLARELAGLNRLHVAHLRALGAPEDWSASDGTPERRDVLAAEARLQRFLVTASVQAGSGALAKLMATMSAAVAQQLAVLG